MRDGRAADEVWGSEPAVDEQELEVGRVLFQPRGRRYLGVC